MIPKLAIAAAVAACALVACSDDERAACERQGGTYTQTITPGIDPRVGKHEGSATPPKIEGRCTR